MRNIEPPLGRGSATNCLLTFARCGAIAAMNSDIGTCTLSLKRSLFASNQARSLFAFNSRKKAKKSFGKPWKSACIPAHSRYCSNHSYAKQTGYQSCEDEFAIIPWDHRT